MNRFERYLSVRVFLCIIAGILLGHGRHAIHNRPGNQTVADTADNSRIP